MQVIEKWTVRRIPEQALDRLWEVRESSGIPLGELLGLAVEHWYRDLPEVEMSGPLVTR
tara:strand:- start:2219 stop:2395 length:177 start_codon:yes stop_codon:yes gene_type:complete